MYMPFMIGLNRVLVFAGERGEGLQKSEKLALFADEVYVIPEIHPREIIKDEAPYDKDTQSFVFKPGPVRWVKEKLIFKKEVLAKVHPVSANTLAKNFFKFRKLIKSANYICSDLSDRKLNERIHKICTKLRIRHTIVDTKDLSDTWFMSIIDAGSLLTAISTRGGVAYFARKTREELESLIQERGEMAQILADFRALIPREKREEALEAIYHDERFRELMNEKKSTEVIAYTKAFARNYE